MINFPTTYSPEIVSLGTQLKARGGVVVVARKCELEAGGLGILG